MPFEDPTVELDEILELVEQHKLPKAAREWATGAMEIVDSIMETISSMSDKGIDAPTERQAAVLENVYIGACRWLHITPVLE